MAPPGSGKTVVGAEEFNYYLRQGYGNALFVGPDFATVRDVMLAEVKKRIDKDHSKHVNLYRSLGPLNVELSGGRTLYTRSAEHEDGIDGLTDIAFVWIDEFDLCPESTFNLIRERIFRPAPSLPSLRRRVIITGTPQLKNGESGVKNLFWERFNDKDPEVHFVRFNIHESPIHDESQKKTILKENPEDSIGYGKYMAEWIPLPDGRPVFPYLPRMGMHYLDYKPHESDEIIHGVDCGYGEHPFVWTILGRKGDIWTLFGEWSGYGESEFQIAKNVADLCKSLNIPLGGPVYHDHHPNQMDNVERNLKALGGQFQYAKAIKLIRRNMSGRRIAETGEEVQLDKLSTLMYLKKFQVHPTAEKAWNHLGTYYWKPTKTSNTNHEDSHWADAVRYGWYTHTHQRETEILSL